MKHCKLLLMAVGAAVLLGGLTSAASARTLSYSSQSWWHIWREVRFSGLFGTTSCQLTLEGSMHERTIPKVRGWLVGFGTRARLGSCASGTATILSETLPWHEEYAGFRGTLPNVIAIIANFINVSGRVRETGGITCLFRSTATEPVVVTRNVSSGTITSAEIGGSVRTGAECFGAAGTFTSDRGTAAVAGTSTRITINLI